MSFIKRELSFFERVRFYQRKGEKHIFIAEKHHFMANTFLVFLKKTKEHAFFAHRFAQFIFFRTFH